MHAIFNSTTTISAATGAGRTDFDNPTRHMLEQADILGNLRVELRRLERASRALDPGTSRRKQLRNAVMASSERFLRRVEDARAYVESETRGAALLDSPIARSGIPIEEAIRIFEENVVEPGGAPASGGHCAYIPGGGLYHSALGDFLAAISNKYAGVFFSGPGAVRMENQLLRWTAGLVGYPSTAAGSIASGGSIANLTAIVAARDAARLRGAEYANAVVYLTRQAHHCVDKALRIAGMAEAQLRYIEMDSGYRMRPGALSEAISADRRNGMIPWLVVASAGTTDVGAVDPLDAIADIAHREACWYHIDAAYGGFFLLTAHGREIMRGIERSDSVVLDPHKSLFLPYGAGIVLVRDAEKLIASNEYNAAYMQDASDPGEISPADLSPELTKHFRAMRMWLPLKVAGTAPFAAALEEKLLLARYFRAQVSALGFETDVTPDLTVVTFRLALRDQDIETQNRINDALLRELRRDGRIFLSSTMLNGRYTIRFVALQFRTHLRTVDLAVTVLQEALDRIVPGWRDGTATN